MDKVNIEVQFDLEEWWSAIFGCAYESLPWWFGEKFHDGGSWEFPSDVTLVSESPFDETDEFDSEVKSVTKRFTVEDIRAAFNKAVAEKPDLLDLDSYDCYSGDYILQIAMYGEVVFG